MSNLTPTMILLEDKRAVKRLDEILLDPSTGLLRILSAETYAHIKREDLSVWCHYNGYYGLPTLELVALLKELIAGRSAIEIGSGMGVLGLALDIPCTDNYSQTFPDVKALYEKMDQPTIQYSAHVEKLDYKQAIRKYKPEVVVGSWITQLYNSDEANLGGSIYGVDEGYIIEQVDDYIHIGHRLTHDKKSILKMEHGEIEAPYIVSRSMSHGNVLWHW